MMDKKVLWGLVVFNLLATAAIGYVALKPMITTDSASSSASIEDQIKTYISAHPKDIIDSVNAYMAEGQSKSDEQTKAAIATNHDFLYAKDAHPVLGNADGDVTIVEFLDYNCGYCKKAQPVLQDLLNKDKNVRLVLIEIPILAESSATAAQWALAINQMGHYAKFHDALMQHKGPIDETVLSKFATDAGADPVKVKELANSQDITGQLAKNLAKAQEMGINGTPGFIIGEDVIRGYVELPAMQASVDKARKEAAGAETK